jgi:hypothetical protein
MLLATGLPPFFLDRDRDDYQVQEKLKLELIQSQMAQTPRLRGEVGTRGRSERKL